MNCCLARRIMPLLGANRKQMAEASTKRPLRAIHQFHAGSAVGDGITNGMLFTRRLLREFGLHSEIYAIDPPAALRNDIHPHTGYTGSFGRADELLLVHYSMGHQAHAWIDAVTCPKILIYHNITPVEYLNDEPSRRGAAAGRQQLALWAETITSRTRQKPFISILTDSDFNKKDLLDLGYTEAHLPIETLPLLIDLTFHENKIGTAKAEALHDAAPAAQLLFVGRLAPHKCQHELILALAALRPRLSRPVRLTLVGGGNAPYRDTVQALALHERLADAVQITGKVSDNELGQLYRSADLFVCLSEHEGFCMPLIEAAVHQIPILAYAGGGAIAETMGEGGLLLTRKDPIEIAAAAKLILEEPRLRRRLLEGQQANLARFDPELLKQRLRQHLERLGFALPTRASLSAKPKPRKINYRIEGPFSSSYSLALVNRELGLALDRAGQKVELRSMEGGIGQFPPDEAFIAAHEGLGKLVAQPSDMGVEAAPTEICLRNMYPPRPDDMRAAGIKGLACYAWEETGFPRAYADAMNRSLDIVTVTSCHVRRVLQDNGVHVPIAVVGDGTDHLAAHASPAGKQWAEKLLSKEAPGFRFLHVSSGFPRKGMDVLLHAWARLSADPNWRAFLIIKTFPNPHNNVTEMVERLRQQHSQLAPILIIQEDLPDDQLLGLYEASNAFVAPSRAEGYGLPLAEAMRAGKPVITTGWGGQVDFCTNQTAWLVDWDFAWAKTHLGVSASVWAEPKLGSLITQMRAVYDADAETLQPRLMAAKALLASEHSWDHVAQRLHTAVTDLKRMPAKTDLAFPKIAIVSTWASRCGIAAYAEAQASAIPPDFLHIFANDDAIPLSEDRKNIRRVWRSGLQDDLCLLTTALQDCDPDVVVFQFNFGFFRLDVLGRLINRLRDAGKAVHVILHSTADVDKPDLKVSLRDAAPTFARATRLIVHGLDDLNRLKAFGLGHNATLMPHGVPALPMGSPGQRKMRTAALHTRQAVGFDRVPLIATFGFLLPGKGLRQLLEAHHILCRSATSALGTKPHLLMLNALYPAPVSEKECNICQELIRKLGLTGQVTLMTDYVPEEQALTFLNMADLIVFPYQTTQESSSAAVRMGLASRRPVAVTPLAIFDDVRHVTLQLPGITPPEMAAGIEELLKGGGHWRRRRWFAPKTPVKPSQITEQQAAWVDACAWFNLAHRFWGILRATAGSLSEKAPNA